MRHDMIRPLDSAIQVTVFSCSRESEKVCMFYYNICCSQFQQHHYRKHDENMFNSVHSSVFIIITLVMSLLCRCFSMATNSELFQVPSTSSWASWPAQRWLSWVFDRFAFDIGSPAVLGGWIGGEDFLKHPLVQVNYDISQFDSWLQEVKAPVTCVFLGTLNCNPIRMLLASKIRRCIEQIIQCPLILTFDSIQPGLQHHPIQSTSNFQWMLMDILILR